MNKFEPYAHELGAVKIGCLVVGFPGFGCITSWLEEYEKFQQPGLVIDVKPCELETADICLVMFPDRTLSLPDYYFEIVAKPDENL